MKKLIYLSVIAMAFLACEKEKTTIDDLAGNYTGTFRTKVNNKEVASDFEMTLDTKRFTTTKGGAGKGPYELLKGNELKFTDELFYTANFDWNILLSGNYHYDIKGDSIILTKILANPSVNIYQYRLKKIK